MTLGFDLLHRRIEEWTERAQIEPDAPMTEIEGFGEYGADLVAFLQDVLEELEVTDAELMLASNDAPSGELCEELVRAVLEEWERLDFGERPAGLELDDFRQVMESVAEVLESEPGEVHSELEEAVESLDEFLADAW